MKKTQLKVEPRKVLGRKVKKLRQTGTLPANIYGKKVKSQAVQVNLKDFQDVYKQAGETGVVYLITSSGKAEKPVLIHNVQLEPVKDSFLHADFHQVDLKEKVTASVPVEITGKAPAEDKGLVLLTLLDEIEVEALPGDLPDKFSVDVSTLSEVDQGISIKDLKFDRKKVKPLVESEEELLVKINEPTPEEEEKPAEKVEEEEEEKVEEGKEEKVEKEEEKVEEKKPSSAKASEGKPEAKPSEKQASEKT